MNNAFLFKFKADKNFNLRHISNISRIKIFIQRRNWAKTLFMDGHKLMYRYPDVASIKPESVYIIKINLFKQIKYFIHIVNDHLA